MMVGRIRNLRGTETVFPGRAFMSSMAATRDLWSDAMDQKLMATILIVDDDFTIRAMFSRALKDLGEIAQASNGADALRLLGAQKFSVVLLDLHMPGIDGFVILHTLASKPGPNK